MEHNTYSGWMSEAPFAKRQRDNEELREALTLIKMHITESGVQSMDLHNAVQKIVNVARRHNLLLEGE